jgi:hypothetical protein
MAQSHLQYILHMQKYVPSSQTCLRGSAIANIAQYAICWDKKEVCNLTETHSHIFLLKINLGYLIWLPDKMYICMQLD